MCFCFAFTKNREDYNFRSEIAKTMTINKCINNNIYV